MPCPPSGRSNVCSGGSTASVAAPARDSARDCSGLGATIAPVSGSIATLRPAAPYGVFDEAGVRAAGVATGAVAGRRALWARARRACVAEAVILRALAALAEAAQALVHAAVGHAALAVADFVARDDFAEAVQGCVHVEPQSDRAAGAASKVTSASASGRCRLVLGTEDAGCRMGGSFPRKFDVRRESTAN